MTRHIPWILIAIIGAVALSVVAVSRGEAVNALWIVVAAVSSFLVAYRYYALFIARNVMRLDPGRPTPAQGPGPLRQAGTPARCGSLPRVRPGGSERRPPPCPEQLGSLIRP